jgi:hypothetical protein
VYLSNVSKSLNTVRYLIPFDNNNVITRPPLALRRWGSQQKGYTMAIQDTTYNQRWKKSFQRKLNHIISMTLEDDEPMLEISKELKSLNMVFNHWHLNKAEEERNIVAIQIKQQPIEENQSGN